MCAGSRQHTGYRVIWFVINRRQFAITKLDKLVQVSRNKKKSFVDGVFDCAGESIGPNRHGAKNIRSDESGTVFIFLPIEGGVVGVL